ncbi:MAG: hypothetical protein LUF30_06025 [Lachnospiraceae bacterium]|nr:hypothetical protein [Lachnospiraceae bacterium]
MEGTKSRRSENAFVKQIFDKDTGKSLVCHLHQEDEAWQSFWVGGWDG